MPRSSAKLNLGSSGDLPPTEDSASSEVPAPTETPAPEHARPPLNLQPVKSKMSTPGLVRRPIDPSPVRVSHTVSIAGTRPVMANPRSSGESLYLNQAPKILNRPIAPNVTEDTQRLLEYLD